jgi:hypothetical protein
VAHTCNSSYSGDRDQEDHGSEPAQAILKKPYLEKNHHKKMTGGVAQGVGPEFKPQYCKQQQTYKKPQTTTKHS